MPKATELLSSTAGILTGSSLPLCCYHQHATVPVTCSVEPHGPSSGAPAQG